MSDSYIGAFGVIWTSHLHEKFFWFVVLPFYLIGLYQAVKHGWGVAFFLLFLLPIVLAFCET